jgi:hypothetical protein
MRKDCLKHSTFVTAPTTRPSHLGYVRIGAEELKVPDAQRAYGRPFGEHHWRHRQELIALKQHEALNAICYRAPLCGEMLPPDQIPIRSRERQSGKRLLV